MYHPDALDRQLILLLQQDGRTPYVKLAHAVGASEATVRRRVERLLAEGVIEIVACVDPVKVGLEIEAMAYLQVDLDKLIQIGQQLAGMPEVRQVIYTSGNYNLVVLMALPASDEILPFLTQQIAAIPGIKAAQTSYVLQVEKRSKDWQLPKVPPVEKRPAPPGPLLLLVDDDADFAAAAKMVLEAEGYRITVACNGRDALAWLRRGEERPDLILLDLIMETPLVGLEVARTILTDDSLQGIPILAISSVRFSEWAGAWTPQELPIDDFLDKPIEPGVLLEKVRRLIG